MGLFRSRAPKGRERRVEPRLFAGRGRVSEPRKPRRRRRSWLGGLFKFALVMVLCGAAGLASLFVYLWLTLNQHGVLKIPQREPGLILLASDGSVLAEQGSFDGDDVNIRDLPDYVPNAVIAIEDRRFRSHFGVDPVGLVRAAYVNYRAGRLVQGGSTLTQQLAKNLFLNPDRTIERKLQEAVLALWLEAKFSKDEILQLYLNRVYFGSGATGIEAAARNYYRKSASELTLAEAATMAGVLKAPSATNPTSNEAAAAERAKLVIASMREEGFITEREAASAIETPAAVIASDYVPATQYIVDWAVEQLPEFVKDYDQSLVIETTIDPSLQAIAERSLRKRLNEEGRKLGVSQGALVVLDRTGAVKAMVGGRSYKKSQFNRVTKAKRQPGSAFKPFVYLAALEAGYTPESVEVDEPVRIGNWQPENYGQKYFGPVTLTKALALSLNSVAAKLGVVVGPAAVAATAHRLGITSQLGNDASLALGTSEVTLLELTDSYVPFANGGYPVTPHVVTRISTRDGRLVYRRDGSGFARAISGYELGALNTMMRAVISGGTARRAALDGIDVAGKTGTSQDYRDAWFIGYSSELVTGVWVGNDDNSPTKKVTGGSIPAAVWKDVMEFAHGGIAAGPLPGGDDGSTIVVSEAPSQDEGLDPEGGSFLDNLFGLNTGPEPGDEFDQQVGKPKSNFERMKKREGESR